MLPIEQTSMGMLVFLQCGCAAMRGLTHPTGAAVLVQVFQPCGAHAGEAEHTRSVLKGQLVSPYVRTPVEPGTIEAR
jgi:hypothetical protein